MRSLIEVIHSDLYNFNVEPLSDIAYIDQQSLNNILPFKKIMVAKCLTLRNHKRTSDTKSSNLNLACIKNILMQDMQVPVRWSLLVAENVNA